MNETDRWIIGLSVSGIIASVAVIANGHAGYGVPLLVAGAATIAWRISIISSRNRAAQQVEPSISVIEIVRWLRDKANYGTTRIQNAIDVRVIDDVETILKPRFRQWSDEVESGVNRHCLESDAQDIEYLDKWNPHGFKGLNTDHTQIQEMTCEMVERIRRLAGRLERGETKLKS